MTMTVNGAEVYGYVGQILKINLTTKTTEVIPTSTYAPEWVGGRTLATRVYWDEVQSAPGAFDPENTLVFMTGPGCGTGLPYSSRGLMVGVGAMGVPEQFMYSGIGGMFSSILKYAGYDGFILTGKADEHTMVVIDNDKVEFRNADWLWGKYVADTQDAIIAELGQDFFSMVIGPAGENLVRFASVTTSNDAVLAKAGYGAVFGSKNLKAIAVRGTGYVEVGDKDAVLELRKAPAVRPWHKNPAVPATPPVAMGWDATAHQEGDPSMNAFQINCLGCVNQCARSTLFVQGDPLPGHEGDDYSMVNKCLDPMAFAFRNDCGIGGGSFNHDPHQEVPGQWQWCYPAAPMDDNGPYADFLKGNYPGDYVGLWDLNNDFGLQLNWLCNQYGMDKWEINVGIFPWLTMGLREGVFDGMDLGFDGEPATVDNLHKIMHNITYREGFGDVLAEGVARATRKLGKAKFGDTIYHGRFNSITGERLDIPISWETCWGFVAHWAGRGFQGCPKYVWLMIMLGWMVSGRETASGEHPMNWCSEIAQFVDDPYHSPQFIVNVLRNVNGHDLKDMTTSCDFCSQNPMWPTLEADLFSASTGIKTAQAEMEEKATKSRLITRAVYMRNHHRCRDMEVDAMFPWMTWPDPWGETASWDDWNDLVDAFYDANGWDLATGWPFRSTWESYGMGDIADEMEALGMLPPEGGTPGYVRKPCPFPEHGCPVAESPEEAWKNVRPDVVQHYETVNDPRMRAIQYNVK